MIESTETNTTELEVDSMIVQNVDIDAARNETALASLQKCLQWYLQCGWSTCNNMQRKIVAFTEISLLTANFLASSASMGILPVATGAAILDLDTGEAAKAGAAGGLIFMLPLVCLAHLYIIDADNEIVYRNERMLCSEHISANFSLIVAYYVAASIASSVTGQIILHRDSVNDGKQLLTLATESVIGSTLVATTIVFFAHCKQSMNGNRNTATNTNQNPPHVVQIGMNG